MAHNPWPFRAVTRTAALPEAPFRPQRRGVPEAHGRAPRSQWRERAPLCASMAATGRYKPGAIILTPAQAYGAKLLL